MAHMTDEQLKLAADHYGISMDEARRRHAVLMNHKDNPEDPICVGCARRPHEIDAYIIASCASEGEYEELVADPEEARKAALQYVIKNEGTLNRTNGHFLCDRCYIINGSPSSDQGWVAR